MKSYPTKFKSFLRKIVQMGALQKLQNSIQTLIILWPVYPIHTNSLFWVIFEELPFCHFPPPNTSILGKDSQIQLAFHLNILVFFKKKNNHTFSQFCHLFVMGYIVRKLQKVTTQPERRNLPKVTSEIVPASKSGKQQSVTIPRK